MPSTAMLTITINITSSTSPIPRWDGIDRLSDITSLRRYCDGTGTAITTQAHVQSGKRGSQRGRGISHQERLARCIEIKAGAATQRQAGRYAFAGTAAIAAEGHGGGRAAILVARRRYVRQKEHIVSEDDAAAIDPHIHGSPLGNGSLLGVAQKRLQLVGVGRRIGSFALEKAWRSHAGHNAQHHD